MLEVFKESFVSGSWTLSCQREVIALFPNKGTLQDIEKLTTHISALYCLQDPLQILSCFAEVAHPPGSETLHMWRVNGIKCQPYSKCFWMSH